MAKEDFFTVNIAKCLSNKIEGLGEADLKLAISTFSSIDPHVESFLKKNAEDFSRQHFTASSFQLPASSRQLLIELLQHGRVPAVSGR